MQKLLLLFLLVGSNLSAQPFIQDYSLKDVSECSNLVVHEFVFAYTALKSAAPDSNGTSVVCKMNPYMHNLISFMYFKKPGEEVFLTDLIEDTDVGKSGYLFDGIIKIPESDYVEKQFWKDTKIHWKVPQKEFDVLFVDSNKNNRIAFSGKVIEDGSKWIILYNNKRQNFAVVKLDSNYVKVDDELELINHQILTGLDVSIAKCINRVFWVYIDPSNYNMMWFGKVLKATGKIP